jgi:glycosyltransferase involved in cell wall biosynthesis
VAQDLGPGTASAREQSVRILWISHTGGIGGAEQGMVEAIDALAARGHENHVVMRDEGPLRERLTSARSVHVCWHNWWAQMDPPSLLDRLRWAAYDGIRARRGLANLVDSTDAEVIVSNSIVAWAGALAARDARRPHVWFLHEYGYDDHGYRFNLGNRTSLAFMRYSTDLFLVNSGALRTHFSRWFPERKIRRVRYAVEVPNEPPAEQRGERNFRLALVGWRKLAKGQQDAVEALERLVGAGLDLELDLIGSEGEVGFDRHLREVAGAATDRIHFFDYQDNPFELLARADVGLMCSRSEAFGRVTIEAMKLGKPVIGTASGATPELIRQGWNGLLYAPGNAAELADCIERLYVDRSAAREMGRRGRTWANESFNRDVYGTDLENALGELGLIVRQPRD